MPRNGTGFFVPVSLVLLLLPAASTLPPEAVPPGSTASPGAYPSSHEAAFLAADALRAATDRVLATEGGTDTEVRDQMLAVLVYLHRAQLFPDRAAEYHDLARRVFVAADAAYTTVGRFYYVNFNPSVCIPLEPNAWALLASERLWNQTGDSAARARAVEVDATLRSIIIGGSANGVPPCPGTGQVPPSQWPLPLWALLRWAEAAAPASRDAALQGLRVQSDQWFAGDAYIDAGGLFLVQTNAQYLLVLQAAALAQPTVVEHAQRRDAVALFIRDHMLVVGGADLFAHNVQPNGGLEPTGEPDPLAQTWLALALHNERLARPTNVLQDAPERLLRGLVPGLAGDLTNPAGGSATAFRYLGLAAWATQGPALDGPTADPPRIAFVVPAQDAFQFPELDAPNATSYYVTNEWTFRFGLDPIGPNLQSVLVPLEAMGPVQYGDPTTPYTPGPSLTQGGLAVPATLEGTTRPLLRFTTALNPAAAYRLTTYAPVFPVSTSVEQRTLQVLVRNDADEPITLAALELRLDARDIQIDAVSVDARALATSDYSVAQVQSTTFLPRDHLRLELRGVELRGEATHEILIAFTDGIRPTVEKPIVSTDAQGVDVVQERNGVHAVGPGGAGWVRVRVQDNFVIDRVELVEDAGLDSTVLPMQRAPQDPSVWSVQLPALPRNEPRAFVVRAVDAQGQINTDEKFTVESRSALFQEGNLVLLVFSATLFVASIVIFAKMGRRRVR